jgi:hypothetical protein
MEIGWSSWLIYFSWNAFFLYLFYESGQIWALVAYLLIHLALILLSWMQDRNMEMCANHGMEDKRDIYMMWDDVYRSRIRPVNYGLLLFGGALLLFYLYAIYLLVRKVISFF